MKTSRIEESYKTVTQAVARVLALAAIGTVATLIVSGSLITVRVATYGSRISIG